MNKYAFTILVVSILIISGCSLTNNNLVNNSEKIEENKQEEPFAVKEMGIPDPSKNITPSNRNSVINPEVQEFANEISKTVRDAAIDEFPSGTPDVTTYRDNNNGFELSLPDVFKLGTSGMFYFIIGDSARYSGGLDLVHCIPGKKPTLYEDKNNIKYDEHLFREINGIELFKRTSTHNATTRINYWFVTKDKCLSFRFMDSESVKHKVAKYSDDIMQSLKFLK